ncbi:MAG: hypothetical protein JOZ18_20070, partial [Chloroflexi bacterium]|nr:hypothetical protein [Chloroflexota bacterium]
MAKLQDLFTQARRTQSGGGMGFLGKGKTEGKAHAAALVVEFAQISAGSAEAALKAGADGLLFAWDARDSASLETLKSEIDSARASNQQLVCGLHITGGWDKLDPHSFTQLKEQGVQYVILPFNAPARLLALEEKEMEKVVTVPLRKEDLYPIFIRNLTALDGVSGVLLDFDVSNEFATMTIEDILQYRAIREAVRFPAFLYVEGDINEGAAYTLNTLGVQAVILKANADDETTRQQIKTLRGLLE